MTTALWLLTCWGMFCAGFVAGCWWLSLRAVQFIDPYPRAGFDLAHPPTNPAPPTTTTGPAAPLIPERAAGPKEAHYGNTR